MNLLDLRQKPGTGNALEDTVNRICSELGVDYIGYANIDPGVGTVSALTNYPEEWREHYKAHNLHAKDPAFLIVQRTQGAVEWGELAERSETNALFIEARDFGILETGVTIPVKGVNGEPGVFSATSSMPRSMWRKHLREIMTMLQQEATLLHDKILHCESSDESLFRDRLSQQEIDILQWLAAGKSLHDIGDILTLSERALRLHVSSACYKLSALSVPQAVTRATAYRLIRPNFS